MIKDNHEETEKDTVLIKAEVGVKSLDLTSLEWLIVDLDVVGVK